MNVHKATLSLHGGAGHEEAAAFSVTAFSRQLALKTSCCELGLVLPAVFILQPCPPAPSHSFSPWGFLTGPLPLSQVTLLPHPSVSQCSEALQLPLPWAVPWAGGCPCICAVTAIPTQPILTCWGTSGQRVPLTMLQNMTCWGIRFFLLLFLQVLRSLELCRVRCSHHCTIRMSPMPWAFECWSINHKIWNLFQVAERILAVPMMFNKVFSVLGQWAERQLPILPIPSWAAWTWLSGRL